MTFMHNAQNVLKIIEGYSMKFVLVCFQKTEIFEYLKVV